MHPSHGLALTLSALALLAGSAPALALQQPNGTVIPATASLQGLFDGRGEQINALNDASVTPQTFIPGCALTFTVLQRLAGYKNSFGWYNVTGNPPGPQDLHEFLTCNDGVGTVKTLDIKNDPGYAGGEIGFYEATGSCATTQNHDYLFFSEIKYNPDGNQADPYKHLLIYNSTATDKAFYFGWEDLLSGGDNDFDDLTTFVTGITCAGGGGACETGALGVCGDGTLQCQSGKLDCLQSNAPSAEKCDGLDNDCDGAIDAGEICPAGQVCDKGSCVPQCGSGEFTCEEGKVCNPGGYCVDPACVELMCPGGTKCVAGKCVGPCDDVVCPHGQVCRVGACVDPCSSITCDPNQVCVAGACVDPCQCSGCAAGLTCQPDGVCVPDGCVGKPPCDPGKYCAPDGTCADECAGAVCPAGEQCVMGACVPGGGAGGGGQGGGSVFVGAGGLDMAGAGGQGGAGAGNASSGGSNGAGGSGNADDSSGCGCRIPGGDQRPTEGLIASILGAIGLFGALRRRSLRAPLR